MRSFLAIVLVLAVAPAAPGQDLAAGIDHDLLHALLLPGGQAAGTSIAMPEALAGARMPPELQWVGSIGHVPGSATQPGTVTAVWRTSLPLEQAGSLAASALQAQGWISPVGTHGQPAVFHSTASLVAEAWCRDGQALSLTGENVARTSYIALAVLQAGAAGAVAACAPRPQPLQSDVAALLPRLELPRDPRSDAPAPLRSVSASSSTTGLSVNATFVLAQPAPDISADFARQLAEQQWKLDADWSGTDFAGSVWSKAAPSGTRVTATLHVVELGGNRRLALLNLSPQPG